MAERNRRRTDVKLFQDQTQSDAVDVSFIMGSSSSLNEVEAEKGVVVGRVVEAEVGVVVGNLTFSYNGDVIDCTKMGIGGIGIPLNIDLVEDMESNALFILLVEKEGAYIRLASERFYNRFPCIIIAAKGQPDVATQFFLRKIKLELKIPFILALVGCDPDGLKIMSGYMCGLKNIYSANLTTLDIKWVGIRPSDLDKHKIPEECRLTMTQQDIKIVKDLLEEDFVKKNPGWVRELELMVKTKQKAEIHALCSRGLQYLSKKYLPRKLQDQDWL